jgi:hypothetical protein
MPKQGDSPQQRAPLSERDIEALNRALNVNPVGGWQIFRTYLILGVPPLKIVAVAEQARRLFAEFSLSIPRESDQHRAAWATEVGLCIAALAKQDELQNTLFEMLNAVWETQRDPREPMHILRIKALSAWAYQTLTEWKVKGAASQVAAVARKHLGGKVPERSVRDWNNRLNRDEISPLILFNEMPLTEFPFSAHHATKAKSGAQVAARAVLKELEDRLKRVGN